MSGLDRARAILAALLIVAMVVGCGQTTSSTPPNAASAGPDASSAPVASAPTGNAPAASAPATATAVTPARWADCGDGFQCARIDAPRDHDDPSAGTLKLEIIRRPAGRQDRRIGSLVVNPGGPGGSGIEFVREGLETFPREIRDRFDIVGFDPRGVNSSSPIRCIDDLDPRAALDPSPDDAAELDELVRDAEMYAEACTRRNADALPFLSTDAVARDLDLIRAAIGDEKLTYIGFSYGTQIGTRYAELFGDRIRAMVLDGAVDPSLDLERFRADQAVAFEAALGRFFKDCSSRRSCLFHEKGKTEKAFDALMARIDKEPLPTPRAADRRKVGPGLAFYAVLGAMYSESYWETLAASLALAKRGDGSLMLLIADPFRGRKPNGAYSNMVDAYTAVNCLDYPAPTRIGEYSMWADDLRDEAPHFAQETAYNDLACMFWPVPAERTPAPAQADDAPPIVIVGTTGDPATPYPWAKALAKQLSSSTLVKFEGEGHTAYQQSACVEKAVDDYLLDLDVPKSGLTC